MTQNPPIYTRETECQDCSKCVRYCPVKAIKVADGQARIIPEKCVACGTCVRVCPANAKRVRDDLDQTKRILDSDARVFVSLAPSFVSEFPDIPTSHIITALHKLGFSGVSETALGAQEVSTLVAADLAKGENRLYLSSACPAAVTYIQKYLPDLSDSITTVLSPLLSHSTMLREHFGADIRIIFIGPCGAKKNEADRHPELLDTVITFADLRQWLEDEGIDLATLHPGPQRHVRTGSLTRRCTLPGGRWHDRNGTDARRRRKCALHHRCRHQRYSPCSFRIQTKITAPTAVHGIAGLPGRMH